MSRSLHVIRRSIQLVALLALCACGPQSRSESAAPGNDPATQRAAAAVEDYIVKSKRWKKDRFEVTFNRKEGTVLVFWVIHADDKDRMATGGGKSVVVLVDPVRNKVVQELGFQ